MIGFLLRLCTDIAVLPGWQVGLRIPSAAEALEKPTVIPSARRYQIAAFCLFMATAMLLLSSAILHTAFGPGLSDAIGWAGIVCMNLCVICGLRYGRLNREVTKATDQRVFDKAQPSNQMD